MHTELSIRLLSIALTLCLALGGCSINQLAMNKLGDALASSGSGFGADDDPELVALAAPFSLKLMESILAETPRHRGLLLAVTQGFVQYGYAFVELNADAIEDQNLQGALANRERARRLYLRARNYGLRGLEASHPGIVSGLRKDPANALVKTTREDVGLLYWTGVAWAAAISLSKDNPFLIADLPVVEALVRRALALDESYDHGGIHSFMISFEMGGKGADAAKRARHHYARARELTGGKHAGPYLAYAEAVCIAEHNRAEFERTLHEALRVDPNAKPEWQLVNTIMQRRARWLLSRTDRLFAE